MQRTPSSSGPSSSARVPALALVAIAALVSSISASAQTLARIRETGQINIGYTPNQPPFSSAGVDGKPRGYSIELCQHVASALKGQSAGFEVNYVSADPAQGLALLQQGKIDMLCGAITETVRARQQVSFSVPIFFTGVGAAVRRDAPDALLRALAGNKPHTGPTWRATVNQGLANYTYAVRAGSEAEEVVRERAKTLGVIAKILPVDSEEEGLDLVKLRKAQAFFADRTVLASELSRRSDANQLLVADRRFTIAPGGIALPRGDEDFRLAVDRALSEHYRSGDYVRTFVPYFGEPSDTARTLFQAYALR